MGQACVKKGVDVKLMRSMADLDYPQSFEGLDHNYPHREFEDIQRPRSRSFLTAND